MKKVFLTVFLIVVMVIPCLQARADGVPGYYPSSLSYNSTGFADSTFLGAPDDAFVGIGYQDVVYDFVNYRVVNGSGNDFNVYEVDWGNPEFAKISISASLNGVDWYPVINQAAAINLEGDEAHGNASYRQSFDLPVELAEARYIKIDGISELDAGGTNDFDLDAIGAVHFREVTPTGAPEPATMLLLGLGLLGVLGLRKNVKE